MQRLATASPQQLIMVAFIAAVVIVVWQNWQIVKSRIERE